MGHPQSLFNLFLSFQTSITILQHLYVKKCPSSIKRSNSNPQPSEHESPPVERIITSFSHTWDWAHGSQLRPTGGGPSLSELITPPFILQKCNGVKKSGLGLI